MNQEMTEVLFNLLNKKKQLINLEGIPHDYPTLKEKILQLELIQEIDALHNMLSRSESFEEEFKKRCASRELSDVPALPFSDLPQSLTNVLYWEIAALVFKPQNLKEMLEIVAPNSKRCLDVVYKEEKFVFQEKEGLTGLAKNRKFKKQVIEYSKRQSELIGKEDVDLKADYEGNSLKKAPPHIEELMHYVLTRDTIFNVKKIEYYSLYNHNSLYEELKKTYPKLTEKLYQHNFDMEQLLLDINTLNGQGLTPKSLIEQLIKKLNLGGTRVTQSDLANENAQRAVTHFYEYFNELPDEIQKELRSLEYEMGKTLGDIIDNEIKKAKCVETTASHLSTLLQKNSNKEVLNKPPKMSLEDLKKLECKYTTTPKTSSQELTKELKENKILVEDTKGNEILNTKKGTLVEPNFPKELAEKAIQQIAPKTFEDLIHLLLDFPSEYYDILWRHINLSKPDDHLWNLNQAIQKGFFNPVQKQALAKAICANYNRFTLSESVLFWAIRTNETLFLKEALSLYTTENVLEAVKVANDSGDTVLHYAASNPEFLKAILGLLSEEDRLAAVKVANDSGDTVLHKAASNPEYLKVILGLLSEKDRLVAVKVANKDGDTVLHKAASNPESLKAILALYPEKDRLAAVEVANDEGNTVLHKAASNPESLRAILVLYPEKDRLAAVKVANIYDHTVLHKAASYPQSLKVILRLLPEKGRLNALKTKINESTLLEQLIKKNKEVASMNDRSFTRDFFIIYSFLRDEAKNEANKKYTFFNKTDATTLLDSLNQKESFDEIKQEVSNYINNNPDNLLSTGLLQQLKIDNASMLCERWQVVPQVGFFKKSLDSIRSFLEYQGL